MKHSAAYLVAAQAPASETPLGLWSTDTEVQELPLLLWAQC